MKRSITRWTTSLAAAALLALPAAALAQTSGTAQPPATSAQPPASAAGAQPDTAQNAAAQEHLRQAKSALDAIKPVTGRAKTQVAELKQHLNALDRASGTNSNASTAGAASRSTPSTATRGNANWGTEVAAIDKILTSLIGPVGTTGGSADPTSTTGTSGTTASTLSKSAATAVTLDEATRAQLMEVRTHVTAYAVAMSGTASDANAASVPSAAKGTTGSTSQDPTRAATPQLNPETARRRLTEARDTLTQLTQLPAAAQLSGEARTQVSQLIANFNELTAAQSEWRSACTKVEANLDALLGPNNTDAERTGGVSAGTTGTTGATGGAVGTSGTATGAVSLDPAVRAKLVELRQKLNEFEKAAGGNVTASASTSSATDPMTGATGSMQSTTPQTATQANEAMGHQEAMRHIAAIEAILNANGAGTPSATSSTTGTAGTSGTTGSATAGTTTSSSTGTGLTLTSAQLEQLRTHLAELKRLMAETRK